MAKFVPDIKTQRWIIIAPARSYRPDEHIPKDKPKVCVFCPGNENLTPAEIMRVGEGNVNEAGWKVRVVPNKYPITDIHEVIIHNSDHIKDLTEFEVSEIYNIFYVYRKRFEYQSSNGQVLIFCNQGEHAGASLTHPHSQLVVLPKQINLDALVREPVNNVIEEFNFFITYCPDFSQWPFELWIAYKKDGTIYPQINDEELKELAEVFRKSLRRLNQIYSSGRIKKMYPDMPFAYNYYIHHGKNWFIRIIPRLIHRAGFELGTGLSVNIIDPTIASEELKKIALS